MGDKTISVSSMDNGKVSMSSADDTEVSVYLRTLDDDCRVMSKDR